MDVGKNPRTKRTGNFPERRKEAKQGEKRGGTDLYNKTGKRDGRSNSKGLGRNKERETRGESRGSQT